MGKTLIDNIVVVTVGPRQVRSKQHSTVSMYKYTRLLLLYE